MRKVSFRGCALAKGVSPFSVIETIVPFCRRRITTHGITGHGRMMSHLLIHWLSKEWEKYDPRDEEASKDAIWRNGAQGVESALFGHETDPVAAMVAGMAIHDAMSGAGYRFFKRSTSRFWSFSTPYTPLLERAAREFCERPTMLDNSEEHLVCFVSAYMATIYDGQQELVDQYDSLKVDIPSDVRQAFFERYPILDEPYLARIAAKPLDRKYGRRQKSTKVDGGGTALSEGSDS